MDSGPPEADHIGRLWPIRGMPKKYSHVPAPPNQTTPPSTECFKNLPKSINNPPNIYAKSIKTAPGGIVEATAEKGRQRCISQ